MPNQKKVCIVDDDAGVRASLAALLGSAGYLHSTYDTMTSFHACLETLNCDCVLLDVKLPDGDGIDMLRKIREKGFATPVIVITGHGDVPMAVQAMRLGAADFVEKPFDPDHLLQTIDQACENYSQNQKIEISGRKLELLFSKLTPRETEVMKLLVVGQSNKTIALNLGLSPRTVELHRSRVMEKTSAKSLSHLVRMAIVVGVEIAD